MGFSRLVMVVLLFFDPHLWCSESSSDRAVTLVVVASYQDNRLLQGENEGGLSDIDPSLRQDAAGPHSRDVPPVPLISVSMNNDPNDYLTRLICSIDHPTTKLRIQIGNSDHTIVQDIVAKINAVKHVLNNTILEVKTLDYNPGSAKGFNFGLRGVMRSYSKATNERETQSELATATTIEDNFPQWVLVVNNDIAFYPGVLRKIAKGAERMLHTVPDFGVGFTSLCCGSEWSAVIFTKRLVQEIGYFDENFYPAYYEDDDYGIRIHHSSLRAYGISDTPLLHGEIDGSKDYLSGLFAQLYLRPKSDEHTRKWRAEHELGMQRSLKYIESKWGVSMGSFTDSKKLDCKSIAGINKLCKTGFKTPFNLDSQTASSVESELKPLPTVLGVYPTATVIPSSALGRWQLLQDTIDRIEQAKAPPK